MCVFDTVNSKCLLLFLFKTSDQLQIKKIWYGMVNAKNKYFDKWSLILNLLCIYNLKKLGEWEREVTVM